MHQRNNTGFIVKQTYKNVSTNKLNTLEYLFLRDFNLSSLLSELCTVNFLWSI